MILREKSMFPNSSFSEFKDFPHNNFREKLNVSTIVEKIQSNGY